jgi:hypothetical protein
MSQAIPTSTSVVESAVIKAPLASVWHHIKLEQFNTWYSAISKADYVKGASPDTDVVKWLVICQKVQRGLLEPMLIDEQDLQGRHRSRSQAGGAQLHQPLHHLQHHLVSA